jgi:Ca2+-binding EF-hand superfamily protein
MGNKQTSSISEKNKLTDANIDMLVTQTNLSREKIVEWFKDFKFECKNGDLDKKSFIRFYKEMLPHKNDPEKFCEFVFNGLLNFNYFKFLIMILLFILKLKRSMQIILVPSVVAFAQFFLQLSLTFVNLKDFNEFLLSLSLIANGSTREKLNWIFDMYDLDKSNFIDAKEMKKVLKVLRLL